MHTSMYIYKYTYTHTGNRCKVKQNLSWILQTCFLDYDAIYNIESARRSPFIVSWKPLSSHNPKFNRIWKNRSAHRNSNFPLFVHWKVKEAMFGLQSSWWPVYCCLHAEGGQTQWCTISLFSELFYKGGNIECKIDSDCASESQFFKTLTKAGTFLCEHLTIYWAIWPTCTLCPSPTPKQKWEPS